MIQIPQIQNLIGFSFEFKDAIGKRSKEGNNLSRIAGNVVQRERIGQFAGSNSKRAVWKFFECISYVLQQILEICADYESFAAQV
jgi:hypothetical protein